MLYASPGPSLPLVEGSSPYSDLKNSRSLASLPARSRPVLWNRDTAGHTKESQQLHPLTEINFVLLEYTEALVIEAAVIRPRSPLAEALQPVKSKARQSLRMNSLAALLKEARSLSDE